MEEISQNVTAAQRKNIKAERIGRNASIGADN